MLAVLTARLVWPNVLAVGAMGLAVQGQAFAQDHASESTAPTAPAAKPLAKPASSASLVEASRETSEARRRKLAEVEDLVASLRDALKTPETHEPNAWNRTSAVANDDSSQAGSAAASHEAQVGEVAGLQLSKATDEGKRAAVIPIDTIVALQTEDGLPHPSHDFALRLGSLSDIGWRVAAMGRAILSHRVDDAPPPAETIRRIMRAHFGEFRFCYEAGLRSNPALHGRVTLRLAIGADGVVRTAADAGSDLPDPMVVACVVRTASNVSFGPSGAPLTLVYPLAFEPVHRDQKPP